MVAQYCIGGMWINSVGIDVSKGKIIDTKDEAEMKRFRAGLKSLGKENQCPKAKKIDPEPMSL